MNIKKRPCRKIGFAMIQSFGAIMEISLFFEPQIFTIYQALNRFMYKVGVSRCQNKIKLTIEYIFTFDSPIWRDTVFKVTNKRGLHCSLINNKAFNFH